MRRIMFAVLAVMLLLFIFTSSYIIQTASSEAEYPTYNEVVEQLKKTAEDFNDIAELHEIGTSVDGRKIYALKISDNVTTNEKDEKEILFMAVHHGNEKVGVPITMALIKKLTTEYTTNPKIKEKVDKHEIWIVPMVNPDGYEKNRRANPNYVDLNRNYAEKWKAPRIYNETDPDWASILEKAKEILKKTENRDITDEEAKEKLIRYNQLTGAASIRAGEWAFSEPETQAIKGLAEGFGGKVDGFRFSISWHSFGGEILYPWCYDSFRKTYKNAGDETQFRSIAEEMSKAIAKARKDRAEAEEGYDVMHPWFSTNAGYNIGGCSEDWLYQKGTFSFTIEAYGEEEGGASAYEYYPRSSYGAAPDDFRRQGGYSGYYQGQYPTLYEHYPGQHRPEGSADRLKKVVENNLAAALTLLNQ